MKCSKCGSTLVPGEKFCGECGTRRPELPPRFEAAEKQFYELKRRLQSGEMEQAAFEKALESLVIENEDGQYWMIGADSEEWHRYDGEEWRRDDPPTPGKSPKQAPLPAERVETPVAPRSPIAAATAVKSGRGKSRWLLPLGGCLMVFVLLCGAGVAFREQLNNAFVNLALDQGWGTVVTEQPAEPEAYVPLVPATSIASRVPPTAAPTRIPTKIPTQRPTAVPAAAWSTAPCSMAGLDIPVPPGFIGKAMDEGLVQMYDQAMTTAVQADCRETSSGQSFEMEMAAWLMSLEYVNQGPLPGTASLGKMAYAGGEASGKTYLYALVGPSPRNHVVYLSGTTTADPETTQDLFLQIAKGIEYQE